MILPIGHENDSVRRLPWVTIIIMAICFVVHLYVISKIDDHEKQINRIGSELIEYYFAHPHLKLDPEIERQIYGSRYGKYNEEFKEIVQAFSKYDNRQPPTEEEVAEQQEELDRLTKKLKDAIREIPYYKWGYTPAEGTFTQLISHMFVHGGWLHLLGNLFMLYLTGPFIEDSWGRPIYAVFYIITGIVAAKMFAMHYPKSLVPMVGASGAISGVMGAFLVRFWKTKIKFFYMFSVIVRGTFNAPAWLMVPLWAVNEFFNAKFMDTIAESSGSTAGVAHWAHIWGFLAGVGIAVAIKYAKVEEKYIAPKIEAETTYVNKSFAAYEEAMQLIYTGKKEEAYSVLMNSVREDPTFQETVESLWNLSIEKGTEKEVAPALKKLIEKEVRHNESDLALYHYKQLKEKIPDAQINPHTKIMFIDTMANDGEYEEAAKLADELLNEIDLSSPPGLLLSFCSAVVKIDLRDQGSDLSLLDRVIQLAVRHPDIPETKKEELKALLDKPPIKAPPITGDSNFEQVSNAYVPDSNPYASDAYSAVPNPGPQPSKDYGASQYVPKEDTIKAKVDENLGLDAVVTSTAAFYRDSIASNPEIKEEPPPLTMPKNFKVTKAVPLGVKEKKLVLNVGSAGQKSFLLDSIQAISVAKITPPGKSPFLLIDLFVDDPGGENTDLRAIRFLSTTFNPQKFVPSAQNPLQAFKAFISGLLKLSGAKPYPDLESVQLKKINAFPTIEEYEKSF